MTNSDPSHGVIESIWLFTRGRDSVRIVRTAAGTGVRLAIYGPGHARAVHDFDDPVSCMTYQSSVERTLLVQAFSLEQFTTERRRGVERRARLRGRDRRR